MGALTSQLGGQGGYQQSPGAPAVQGGGYTDNAVKSSEWIPGAPAQGGFVQPQQYQQQPQQYQQQPQQYQPQTGLMGAESAYQGALNAGQDALQSGLMGGLTALGGGVDQATGDVRSMTGAGVAGYQPYMAEGRRATDLMGAYSGAQGAGAQQRAYDNFISSPGQDWLRERGDRAVTRNASALGGLGGGRVQQELQRQGIGMAAQDFDNSYNRLSGLADRGMQGAQGAGNLYGQAANTLGNIGLQGGLQGSNMFQNSAQQSANMYENTGVNLGNARNQAGRDIASGVGGMSSSLSDLINQGGQGISDMTGAAGGNLAGIIGGAGEQQAAGQMSLAEQLAKQQQDAAAVNAGLPGLPQTQQTKGLLEGLGDAAAGFGTAAYGFSDRRLKTNIQPAGVTPGGTNLYAWDWTATGARLAKGQPTFGVIAQEVPHAAVMGPEGYLMVDYSKVT